MTTTKHGNLETIPGFKLDLPFNNTNDLGQEVQGVYHITSSNIENLLIDDMSAFTAVKAVVINGEPGTTGIITVTNLDTREAAITFSVTLRSCPPLFVYNSSGKHCICYSGNSMQHDYRYICN